MTQPSRLALCALALSSCFAPEAPSDLLVACEATTDCPVRYVCSVAVGRCVLSDVVDKPPALVGTPALLPRIARAGSTLTLELAVSEELLRDPVVRLGERRMVVDEAGTQRARQSYRFAYRVDGTEPQGVPVPAKVDLMDAAGSAATDLAAGEALFDFAAPQAPDVATEGRVVYHRVPWGAQATASARRFWVEAGAGAAEPGSLVLALDGPEELAGELGRANAAEDGAFQLELMRTDRPVVWLSAQDAAGNRSAVVDVKDVDWTASLTGKVQGREFENPHDYEVRPWFERRLLQPDAQELPTLDALAAPGGGVQQTRADTVTGVWVPRSAGEPFSRRYGHAVAYDSRRQRVVLFGGAGWADTWEWDGTAWTKRTPLDLERDGNPSAREGHAMAYDSARDRVVLFGGRDHNGTPLSDLWEWDGVGWARRTTPEAPSARALHAMVYDPGRGRVLLFGGEGKDSAGNTLLRNDLWEWDGARWTRNTAASSAPPARSDFGMAWDRTRKVLVVFGGRIADVSGGFGVHKDTWEWDGAAWKRVPALTPPSARSGAALVHMPHVGVLLFGGSEGANYQADTWLWDGEAWTELKPDHAPPERRGAGVAFDGARNRVVLCGGRDDSGGLADTWEWDGEDWALRADAATPSEGPGPRAWAALAYDEERGRTVLFGGLPSEGGAPQGDTWEWDGGRWTEHTPAAGQPSPPPRARHALAYDALRRRVVLFGGSDAADAPLSDTWEWDGTRWKERTPAAAADSPPARYGHAMAFQDLEGEVALFGGTEAMGWVSFDDTWLWDGTRWRPGRGTGGPSGRSYTALAYDRARSRLVLYGGQAYDAADWVCPPCGFPFAARDTYEWDGGSWRPTQPVGESAPTTLTSHAMAYGQRGQVVLFGGGSYVFGLSPLAETWLWDGAAWTQARSGPGGDGLPVARAAHSLTYDSRRSRAVLFGGRDAAGLELGDTWEWDDGSQARPGQVARFAFAAAQPEAGTEIRAVATTFVAGGEGQSGGAIATGVATWIWDRGAFMPAASGSFPAETPGKVRWETSDPAQTARLINGPRQEIVFAVTPQGANGTRAARVAVDYVELEVRYRRP